MHKYNILKLILSMGIHHELELPCDYFLPYATQCEIHTECALFFTLLDFDGWLHGLFHCKTTCYNFCFCTKQHFLHHVFRNIYKSDQANSENQMEGVVAILNTLWMHQKKNPFNFSRHLICYPLHSYIRLLHPNRIPHQIFHDSHQFAYQMANSSNS